VHIGERLQDLLHDRSRLQLCVRHATIQILPRAVVHDDGYIFAVIDLVKLDNVGVVQSPYRANLVLELGNKLARQSPGP
jgi:hypothetical protein